jgi:hypothetical protein
VWGGGKGMGCCRGGEVLGGETGEGIEDDYTLTWFMRFLDRGGGALGAFGKG